MTKTIKAKKVSPKAPAQKKVAVLGESPGEGERAVLVTTEHKGVFFGYARDTSGATIKLRRGRNVLYWPAETKGFMGLAVTGPLSGSRVGPAADIEVRAITAVVECRPEAVKAFEAGPWA